MDEDYQTIRSNQADGEDLIWILLCKLKQLAGIRWPHWLYLRYLHSETWQRKRKIIIKRAAGQCELCGKHTIYFEVHHIDYTRLGAEHLDDLAAICKDCHKAVHKL